MLPCEQAKSTAAWGRTSLRAGAVASSRCMSSRLGSCSQTMLTSVDRANNVVPCYVGSGKVQKLGLIVGPSLARSTLSIYESEFHRSPFHRPARPSRSHRPPFDSLSIRSSRLAVQRCWSGVGASHTPSIHRRDLRVFVSRRRPLFSYSRPFVEMALIECQYVDVCHQILHFLAVLPLLRQNATSVVALQMRIQPDGSDPRFAAAIDAGPSHGR